MADPNRWLVDYGESHADIRFGSIYWVAVLTLVIGAVGLLWFLPVPAEFADISPALNWGSAFLMAAVVYYFIISMPLAIGMLPFVFGVAAIQIWLGESSWSGLRVSQILLGLSIAIFYLEHRGRGGVRAVVRDLQLIMIGPAWILSVLYRRLGIPL